MSAPPSMGRQGDRMEAKFSDDGERFEEYECFLASRMVDFNCDTRCVRMAFIFTLFVTSSIGPRSFRRCESEMRLLFPILDKYDGIDALFLIFSAAYVLRKPPYNYIEERGAGGGERE